MVHDLDLSIPPSTFSQGRRSSPSSFYNQQVSLNESVSCRLHILPAVIILLSRVTFGPVGRVRNASVGKVEETPLHSVSISLKLPRGQWTFLVYLLNSHKLSPR